MSFTIPHGGAEGTACGAVYHDRDELYSPTPQDLGKRGEIAADMAMSIAKVYRLPIDPVDGWTPV